MHTPHKSPHESPRRSPDTLPQARFLGPGALLGATLLVTLCAAACSGGEAAPERRLGSVEHKPGEPWPTANAVGGAHGRPDGRPQLSDLAPVLITGPDSYDTQPTVALDAAGRPWTAWVANTDGQDRVVCARLAGTADEGDAGSWSASVAITPDAGSYVRPVLAFAGERALCLWTQPGTQPGTETAIWMASSEDGEHWSAPERVTPTGQHLNPELCADGSGGVWAVWMALGDVGYDVLMARYDGSAWGAPVPVSEHPGNDWDPSITCTSSGDPVVAWTAFRDADYDIFVRRWQDGRFGPELRVTDHSAYDLHPSLSIDAQDRPWIAWDRVAIQQHGGSGRIDRSGEVAKHAGPLDQTVCTVELRCLEGDRVLAPAVPPPRLKLGHRLQHCAYPRVECAPDGSVCLIFRAWNYKYAAPKVYWWDAILYRYTGSSWGRPQQLPLSDGYLEELGTAVADGVLWIAAQMEHRVTPRPDALHPEVGSISFEFDHHWAASPQGVNGDLYMTRFPLGSSEPPALTPVPEREQVPSALSERFVPRSEAQHELELDGVRYRVLFGDTHKHSNISRCSAGRDPTPGDHYRYSHDVCRYDFLVVSDHSGHTSDYNWWRLQQTADLFDVQGFFAALYGYEISNGWPTGHKNVIFPERPSRILRLGLDRAQSGAAIWAGLEGERAITIAHTSSGRAGTDWSEHDPRFERLVEVFQPLYGSSEHVDAPRTPSVPEHRRTTAGFVHAALRKGLRMGMIASTDHGFGAAYAVVYATDIGREEVFEALYERRCYGSTVYGPLLEFRAGDGFMGQEVEGSGAIELAVRLRAPLAIERVDLFANTALVRSFEGSEVAGLDPEGWLDLSWTDSDPAAGTSSYYVRATLAGDELVWSSPVWVTQR